MPKTTNGPQRRKAPGVEKMLFDDSVPLELRRELLQQLVASDAAREPVDLLLERATKASTAEQYEKKKREYEELLEQIEAGPLRPATFLRLLPSRAHGLRAQVVFRDGTLASCLVVDPELASTLVVGDSVWLEAQGKALLFHEPSEDVPAEVGEEATLERVLDGKHVEVRMREERFVFRASAELLAQLACEQAEPGNPLVVCTRRMMAFRALPEDDGSSHLRYLAVQPPPDVVVERDLGAPPAYLDELSEHVAREMEDPALGRRYGLRRSRMVLLTGVAGTGKTYSILGFWNRLYALMSAATGAPVAELPPRVFQLKASQILDKWVGSSDRHIARFFEEIEHVANQTFVGPDGREHELPVLVVCEEIDALARTRGEDSIHDRIQTTLLTALDGNNAVFRDRLVILLFTTNTPELVDPAFLRRAGGITETFGRMSRWQLQAVLGKKLERLPVRGAVDALVARAVEWLYASDADESAVCELALVGRSTRDVRHGRDLLTAALVDRAVQEAAAAACRAEAADAAADAGGIDAELLLSALAGQIAAVVDQLTPQNCGRYMTLPDGVRVATVHKRPRPALRSFQLERAI